VGMSIESGEKKIICCESVNGEWGVINAHWER
jgi:hypothetical protein